MADKKQLGMFWGPDQLNFVQTIGTTPGLMFNIAYQIARVEAPAKKNALEAWEKELATNIKQAIQKQKMPASKVNLSLPTKDIIFRSFVIPWMSPGEIPNVVNFEVSKYIPFSLDKLSYAYHPISTTDKGKKQLQIIFVAIKNTALERYTRILKASSLQVNTIEPAASSLIRALSVKELIPNDKTIALIESGEIGRIIIIVKEIPQFVREFHLTPTAGDESENDPDSAVKKLTKEVRISLDYFNRQNEQLRVEKIFFLVPSGDDALPTNLEKHLDIPVVAIQEKSVLDNESEGGINVLNAYGTSIIQASDSDSLFDLSGKTKTPFKMKRPINKIPFDIKLSIKTIYICIPVIILSIAAAFLMTHRLKGQISSFNQELGLYADSDVSWIEKKEITMLAKIDHYKKIRTKSDVAHFLLLIPELLPEGTWLSRLDINYDDSDSFIDTEILSIARTRRTASQTKNSNSRLTMTIDGYAYSENEQKQFRLAHQLLRKIKSKAEIAKFFQLIELETTEATKLDDYNVTYFKIVCKQTDEHTRPQ